MAAVLFDLDGVLIDCKHIHKNAFIYAWNKHNPLYKIDDSLHDSILDGRNTNGKIKYLEDRFNITTSSTSIFQDKQIFTFEELNTFEVSTKFKDLLMHLKSKGFKLGCISNSVRQTVNIVLKKLDIYNIFDCILSNEDIKRPKPYPDIYLRAMELLSISPNKAYILEDSEIGITAAEQSGANVIRIIDSVDVTYKLIKNSIASMTRYTPWTNPDWKLRIVIPMAGDGTRFKSAGYTTPKPLIPVGGIKMIELVLKNLSSKHPELQSKIEYHLCVRSEWVHNLNDLKNVYIHEVPSLTEGPACTVLTIRDILTTDNNPLLIANSDQFLEWDFDTFIYACTNPEYDGCISTFNQPNSSDIKWSYAKKDENGIIIDVAEKKYISEHASTGIYYWNSGSEFVHYADNMIKSNIRVNNEFYVCPVYKLAIEDGKQFRTLDCNKMWGLGVPLDLDKFKNEYLSNQNI